jgi:hypothetical protein
VSTTSQIGRVAISFRGLFSPASACCGIATVRLPEATHSSAGRDAESITVIRKIVARSVVATELRLNVRR